MLGIDFIPWGDFFGILGKPDYLGPAVVLLESPDAHLGNWGVIANDQERLVPLETFSFPQIDQAIIPLDAEDPAGDGARLERPGAANGLIASTNEPPAEGLREADLRKPVIEANNFTQAHVCPLAAELDRVRLLNSDHGSTGDGDQRLVCLIGNRQNPGANDAGLGVGGGRPERRQVQRPDPGVGDQAGQLDGSPAWTSDGYSGRGDRETVPLDEHEIIYPEPVGTTGGQPSVDPAKPQALDRGGYGHAVRKAASKR
jgi:hypothetical protein